MELLVGENLKITSDRLNYIIEQRKVRTEGDNIGDEYWVNAGYYSQFDETIFKHLVNLGLRTSDLKGVREILDYLAEIRKDILKLNFQECIKKLKQEPVETETDDDMLG